MTVPGSKRRLTITTTTLDAKRKLQLGRHSPQCVSRFEVNPPWIDEECERCQALAKQWKSQLLRRVASALFVNLAVIAAVAAVILIIYFTRTTAAWALGLEIFTLVAAYVFFLLSIEFDPEPRDVFVGEDEIRDSHQKRAAVDEKYREVARLREELGTQIDRLREHTDGGADVDLLERLLRETDAEQRHELFRSTDIAAVVSHYLMQASLHTASRLRELVPSDVVGPPGSGPPGERWSDTLVLDDGSILHVDGHFDAEGRRVVDGAIQHEARRDPRPPID